MRRRVTIPVKGTNSAKCPPPHFPIPPRSARTVCPPPVKASAESIINIVTIVAKRRVTDVAAKEHHALPSRSELHEMWKMHFA